MIKKIGNTASVRLGALLLLLSAIFITLGQSCYAVLLGRILHDAAAIFRTAAVVALENNLEALDRWKDFSGYDKIVVRKTNSARVKIPYGSLIALTTIYG